MVRRVFALITVAAAAVLVSACTVKKTEQPALTGPSELALSLALTANPDILEQDGTSQSRIVILARDATGQPVRGLPLHVDLTANISLLSAGRLSTPDVTTGTDGRATITYTAPPMPADTIDRGTIITILVTPTGTDHANATPRAVSIRIVPPSVVTPGPVASFTVRPSIPILNAAATFDGSASRSPSGTIVAWAWDFGDQVTGNGALAQHIYRAKGTYTVTLVVMDDTGRTSAPTTQTLVVDEGVPPTADFVVSPTSPLAGLIAFFNASVSKAGAGRTIVDYAWNFGNGTTGRGVATSTIFSVAGTYTVTLVVTDDVGQTASKSLSVTVH
jgi:PKD repeat protein